MTKEYFPTGFNSWNQFYTAKRNKEARSAKWSEVKGQLRTVVYIFGATAFVFGSLWVGAFLDFMTQH